MLRFLSLFAIAFASSLLAADRPNVLIIYGDGQGSIDMGCYGATDLKTPNFDRLAAQGVRFTQMYAPAPVCSATARSKSGTN